MDIFKNDFWFGLAVASAVAGLVLLLSFIYIFSAWGWMLGFGM